MPSCSISYTGTTSASFSSFASACISLIVGPSGTGSVKSYQRVVCSAQKYGP